MRRPDGHPVLAAILDTAMAPLAGHRERLLPRASGRVLELGAGTGANFVHYDPARVTEIVAVEPDPHMRRRAAERDVAIPVTLVDAGGEALPFEDACFDTVVATWVLCTIPDPEAAAAELRRVVRPTGRLLFAEHVAAHHPVPATVQRTVDPLWCRVAGGCHLHRDGLGILRRAGFALEVDDAPAQTWSLAPIYRGSGVPG